LDGEAVNPVVLLPFMEGITDRKSDHDIHSKTSRIFNRRSF
jgi:hypothetical protein